MARTATEIFVVRNWKYFVNPAFPDVYQREGYAHPLFQFKLSFDDDITSVFVSGEGDVAVKNSFVWDMGDGTIIEGKEATHTYLKSGKYAIVCYFVDADGNRIINAFSVVLDVYDFVSNNIFIEEFTDTPWVSDYNKFTVNASVDALNAPKILKDGGINMSITYDKLTNPSLNYLSLEDRDKITFDHLVPALKFFKVEENGDYTLSDMVLMSPRPVYFKLDANLDVILTENKDESYDGGVVGIHSTEEIVFSADEVISNPFVIWAAFDAKQFSATPEEALAKSSGKLENVQTLNLFAQGFETDALAINPDDAENAYLTFTSNGYDGYGPNETTAFAIFDIRFENTPFPVVLKLKGANKQSLLYLPKLSLPKWTGSETSYIRLLDATNTPIDAADYDVDFTQSDLTPEYATGGYMRPIFTVKAPYPEGLKVHVVITSDGFAIDTTSLLFKVYKEAGMADIRKINEDYVLSQSIADYRTQRVLFDKGETIFGSFIPAMLGDKTTDPLAIGRASYEKTANLIINKHDIDAMLIDSVSSLNSFFDGAPENALDTLSPDLKRTLDLFSTQITTLFGTKVLISEDFADKGFFNQGYIGKNKGTQLDYATAILIPYNPDSPTTPGPNEFVVKKIIAYEKFSETYLVLNPYRIKELSGVSSLDYSPYALKAAIPMKYPDNPSGGFPVLPTGLAPAWNLVLSKFTKGVDGETQQVISDAVTKFYDFFLYVENESTEFSGGLIDFDNENNEVSETFLGKSEMNELLRATLAKNITSAIHS